MITGTAIFALVCLLVFLLYVAFMLGAGVSYRRGVSEGDGPKYRISRKGLRRFIVRRDTDVSGVSGTGIVCEGVVFSDGHAAIHWIDSKYPWTTPIPEGVEGVLEVHGHNGKTRVVWVDEA
jgi:hypothetical protein